MRTLLRVRRPAVIGRLLFASTALVLVAACQQSNDPDTTGELAWAQAALERNPNLEVVAADGQSGVFTVRDRRTNEVRALMLADLVLVPISEVATPAPVTVRLAPAEPVDADVAPAAQQSSQDEPALQHEASAAAPEDESASVAARADYTIERSGGKVNVSGPGLSIVSAGVAPPVSTKGEPGQRTVDPIICEGRRMMHLDGRDIYVDGDAITVRGGCELFITNSRIVASGTGVIVRDGIVHISNSHVEGGRVSFDAAAAAKMYLRDSIFQGISQRDTLALVQDQGGNQLRH